MAVGYIPPALVSKAKEMDLLTYLRTYNPEELVRISDREYCTKTHDSLKISNGKWMWWSRGFGGKNAVDYLIAVEELSFYDAVKRILECKQTEFPRIRGPDKTERKKTLILPKRSPTNENVIQYLKNRGIAGNIIEHCIGNGSLYESLPYHNAVFVGFDEKGEPRFAGLRGTINSDYKGDAYGSDKTFSFRLVNQTSDTVHIFESPIDALSYATLLQLYHHEWENENLLSLSGVYNAKQYLNVKEIPTALAHFLKNNPLIRNVDLHLDNDPAGRNATKALVHLLSDKYNVRDRPVPRGKDVNDYLCYRLHLPITKIYSKSDRERGDAR